MPHLVPAPRRPVTTVGVVVVGGGPLGAAAAWQLARRGVQVMLLERFGLRHRTGPGRDGCRIYRPTGADRAQVRLAEEAGALWRELEAVTGASLLHLTGGVDHGDPERVARLANQLGDLGLPYTWIDPEDAARRWPGMAFDGPVLYQPKWSGRLNAEHAVAALAAAAVAHGANVRHHVRVNGITVRGPSRVELDVELPGGSAEVIRARRVVVAAGECTAGLVDGLVRMPRLRTHEELSGYFPVSDRLLPCGACSVRWPTFAHHGSGGGCHGLPVPGRGVKVGWDGSGADGAGLDGLGLDGLGVDGLGVDDIDHAHDQPGRGPAVAELVSRWLPGADATRGTWARRRYTVSPGSAFVIERNGPVVVGTGVSEPGFCTIPALGRVIADLVDGSSASSCLVSRPGNGGFVSPR